MTEDTDRARNLLAEQAQVLELIAAGRPLAQCLEALTAAVSRLHPGVRAAVLMADAAGSAIAAAFAAHVPASFGAGIGGAPISELAIGTCGTAIHRDVAVACDDIEASTEWSEPWRALCLAHGIRACRSTPVPAPGGKPVASFFLCFAEARAPDAWELRLAEFGAHVAGIVIERDRVLRELGESRAALEAELADTRLLQTISAQLISDKNAEALYETILDAATSVMRSRFASMQMLDPINAGELVLLAERGFGAEASRFWRRVNAGSHSTCGIALATGKRVIEPDVAASRTMQASADQAMYLQTGIRAVQTTPLVSRSGAVLGMISTHWSEPHTPTERDLGLLDILARQAADLLERKVHEDALRDADRRKDEFLATLAHELRNPLAPIVNSLHLLRNAGGKVQTERVHEMLERQVNHMVRLIDDLMDVSRITRGTIELQREPLDVATVLQNAVETSKPLIERARHAVHVALPDEPLPIDGDAVRLAQLFSNLLNNAARYTDPGGRIEVVARREGETALVSVRDNGIGIAADKLPQLFAMFGQIDRSDARSQGGLGIGLALAQRLAQMHGGRVEAASEGAGCGARFTVRLPLAAPRADAAPLPALPVAARRVLVVGDNRAAAESLAMMLGFLDAEVRVAHDGPAALEVIDGWRPRVVLLDLGMPGMDGPEVARRVRLRAPYQELSLVALIDRGREQDRERTRAAGFDHLLVKPVDLAELQTLLASLDAEAVS